VTDTRGVVIEHFGDEPHVAPIDVPPLAQDQVLIEVRAASVNAFDWKAAEGRFKESFDYQFPVTIGRDYAGVVAAVGDAVTRVRSGDAVFGYFTGQQLRRGSFATHVWCAEDECFVPQPAGVPAEVAACLPLCGVVALRCVTAVDPRPGDRVLILGAPGGAGTFAVQLAAARGAHVVASGLPGDGEYLRSLGAADVVEPGPDLVGEVRARHPDGITGLIDFVNYRPEFERHSSLLFDGGCAASVHRAADDGFLSSRRLRGVNVGSFPDRALLDQLGALTASGDLRVPISARYPLAEAPAALDDAKHLHSQGKRLVQIP
jgi:NADPH:quinone reductase